MLPHQVSLPVLPQGNGQCFCKAHVCGKTCAACKDGFFGLDYADYFGCRSKCSYTAHPPHPPTPYPPTPPTPTPALED